MLVRSAVPKLHWPTLPESGGVSLLALLHQMEASQWWSAEVLREHQFRQLRVLLEYAYQATPWHRKLLDDAGIDPRPRNSRNPRAAISNEQWQQLPVLTRQDLQRHQTAMTCARIPETHGSTTVKTTSGSTGAPVAVTKTTLAGLFWSAVTLRDHIWHRRDVMGKLAVIRYAKPGRADPPDGMHSPDWGPPTNQVWRTGPAAVLAIRTDVAEQARWLMREQPNYLLTFPTNLMALADHFQANGLALDQLKEIRTCSEMVTPEIRQRSRDVFGVGVTDIYSTQEVGYVALQCPDHEHYHAQCESALVEVLDDRGRPCAPGEIGRLVVTPLHNFATVLLRYDLGDYAQVGEPCSCGRGLPVLKRVLGRVRNMLTYPDGTRGWVNFVHFKHCRKVAPVRQSQLIQTGLSAMEVRLVVERPLTADEEDSMREQLVKDIGHPFALTFTYHDDLPRDASGKFEDFRSLLDAGGKSASRGA